MEPIYWHAGVHSGQDKKVRLRSKSLKRYLPTIFGHYFMSWWGNTNNKNPWRMTENNTLLKKWSVQVHLKSFEGLGKNFHAEVKFRISYCKCWMNQIFRFLGMILKVRRVSIRTTLNISEGCHIPSLVYSLQHPWWDCGGVPILKTKKPRSKKKRL